MLRYLFLGIIVKIITGLDDTITHVPILASATKARLGKIAFSFGTLLAICFAIVFSLLFSSLIKQFEFYKYIVVGLLIVLAIVIYFDVLIKKPREKAEISVKKCKRISSKRCSKLFALGFFASIATVLDDVVVYSSLFVRDFITDGYIIIGILIATLLEILLVIYFSKQISHLKYKKEIATIGILILAMLILFNIL